MLRLWVSTLIMCPVALLGMVHLVPDFAEMTGEQARLAKRDVPQPNLLQIYVWFAWCLELRQAKPLPAHARTGMPRIFFKLLLAISSLQFGTSLRFRNLSKSVWFLSQQHTLAQQL